MKLDKKDRKLLNLLQEDSRMSLTELSKRVHLSIDAVHNRIKKMKAEGIFLSSIMIDPKKCGLPVVVDVKIKLRDIDAKRYDEFVKYLCELPNVTSLFSASGDYDLTAPIMAKDYDDLHRISMDVRQKFKDIIADWRSAVNLKVYKFESYDMERL